MTKSEYLFRMDEIDLEHRSGVISANEAFVLRVEAMYQLYLTERATEEAQADGVTAPG